MKITTTIEAKKVFTLWFFYFLGKIPYSNIRNRVKKRDILASADDEKFPASLPFFSVRNCRICLFDFYSSLKGHDK